MISWRSWWFCSVSLVLSNAGDSGLTVNEESAALLQLKAQANYLSPNNLDVGRALYVANYSSPLSTPGSNGGRMSGISQMTDSLFTLGRALVCLNPEDALSCYGISLVDGVLKSGKPVTIPNVEGKQTSIAVGSVLRDKGLVCWIENGLAADDYCESAGLSGGGCGSLYCRMLLVSEPGDGTIDLSLGNLWARGTGTAGDYLSANPGLQGAALTVSQGGPNRALSAIPWAIVCYRPVSSGANLRLACQVLIEQDEELQSGPDEEVIMSQDAATVAVTPADPLETSAGQILVCCNLQTDSQIIKCRSVQVAPDTGAFILPMSSEFEISTSSDYAVEVANLGGREQALVCFGTGEGRSCSVAFVENPVGASNPDWQLGASVGVGGSSVSLAAAQLGTSIAQVSNSNMVCQEVEQSPSRIDCRRLRSQSPSELSTGCTVQVHSGSSSSLALTPFQSDRRVVTCYEVPDCSSGACVYSYVCAPICDRLNIPSFDPGCVK